MQYSDVFRKQNWLCELDMNKNGLTMKLAIIISIALSLTGCSEKFIEEFVFRETLKYNLKKVCGDDDQSCKDAVDSQLQGCMDKSNWKQFIRDSDNKEESTRFKKELYACIVDSAGKPHFELKV